MADGDFVCMHLLLHGTCPSISGILRRDGRLQKGDQLLAINGQALEVSHQDAIRILQSAQGTAEIVVARGSAQPEPQYQQPQQQHHPQEQLQDEEDGDEEGEEEEEAEDRPASPAVSPRSVGSGEPSVEPFIQEDQAASAAASPRTAGEEQEDGGGEDVEEDGGGEVDEDDSKLGQEKSDMVNASVLDHVKNL
ncbi:hypothetical protein RRG08_053962 [Elysia crispata]|uniref:PDZ domain-containing protein n=1 Tax=Elysia crispata TaxID=231223 RepID=A0AAE1DEK2_9GAST|nr:hypothetical protein RRG08_053962 [Elysia crispata]